MSGPKFGPTVFEYNPQDAENFDYVAITGWFKKIMSLNEEIEMMMDIRTNRSEGH